MKRRTQTFVRLFVLPALCLSAGLLLPGVVRGQSYSGSAAAIRSGSLLANTAIAQTGSLPANGDALHASLLTADAPVGQGTLHAETLHATAIGMAGESASEASLGGLSLNTAGVNIAADFVMSHARAACSGGTATASGASQISGLIINGVPVIVTGLPNQTITFGAGKVIINEQTVSGGNLTVNSLHIIIDGVADLAAASANAGIACAGLP